MMWNAIWLWILWRGHVLHRELIWGKQIYFAFLRWNQCSSLIVTVFLVILFSSIREIEVPYVFDWEHGTPQHEMQGNRASSCGEGEVSWVFSSCGRHLVYILELRRNGHLKLGFVQRSRGSCLVMTDISEVILCLAGKYRRFWRWAGWPRVIISWRSYLGIPINFHEESGIVTFWSIEFRATLEVSNECEVLCPEEVENYGFL